MQHCRPIRFLTRKPDSAEKITIEQKLKEWKQQHGSVEFRKSAHDELHDRFVLGKNDLIILGHELKDIGQKDSFVMAHPKKSATQQRKKMPRISEGLLDIRVSLLWV
ncbi:MAG: hypothetical protein L0228_12590, partial [Planctomycetes bacterium]|nr:hypothetical protein [Planctomycetota bacterium]